MQLWVRKLSAQQHEITFSGARTISELEIAVLTDNDLPLPLNGLRNVWCTMLGTKQGACLVNIVQTDAG